jgi:hypothetical protein
LRDLGQCQHRRLPQLIVPAYRAASNDKFGLRKKPVGSDAAVVAGLQDIQPGHINFSIRGTADVQFGLVYVDLLEAQMPQR